MTGVQYLTSAGIFLFAITNQPPLEHTKPSIKRVLGVLLSGVKQFKHTADHSLPSSDEVRNVQTFTSTPPYILIVWH
jgi:hypothetical protein